MLTHHRHETRVEVGAAIFPALVVPLDAYPRHLAATENVCAKSGAIRQDLACLPVGADGRNVVLGVARTNACGASGAAREIDCHRPTALGHAAPMIWIVHALVLRFRIALLALSLVSDGRSKTGKELVVCITGHLFTTAFRPLTRRHFGPAALSNFRDGF